MITVGDVDSARNGFDPHEILTDWDTGDASTLPDGRVLREFDIVAVDKEIEIAPGIRSRPGPTTGGFPDRRCA